MRRSTDTTFALAALLSSAALATANTETISFSEVPTGTSIHGVTIAGLATFHSQIQALDAPATQTEGVPDDGPWGEGAFLIGEMGDFLIIELSAPATRAEVHFSLNETIHSSVQMHLQAFDIDGNLIAFEQGFPTFANTWPASLGDSVSGSAVIEGVGEIRCVAVSFAAGPFATMFALDNIALDTTRCNSADLAAPFGVIDFFDIAAYLAASSAQESVADRAAPFGVFDFFDVASYLNAHASACDE